MKALIQIMKALIRIMRVPIQIMILIMIRLTDNLTTVTIINDERFYYVQVPV